MQQTQRRYEELYEDVFDVVENIGKTQKFILNQVDENLLINSNQNLVGPPLNQIIYVDLTINSNSSSIMLNTNRSF